MAELKYVCLLLDTTKQENNTLVLQTMLGQWGWKLCQDAYKTEMSGMSQFKYPEEYFQVEPGYTVLAITEDKRCIGFASLYAQIQTKTLVIGHVYVRPEYRGKGVYKTMVARAEKFAKDIKMERMCAFVHRFNGGSMKAHHKLGFKQEMVGYFKEVK